MSWSDLGFNENLSLVTQPQQIDPQTFEQLTQNISATTLSGLMQSQDGSIKLDLDKNNLIFKKGNQEISLGALPDGTFGFQFIDQNGIKIIKLNESEKFIAFDSSFLLKRADNNNLLLDQNGINSSSNFILGTYSLIWNGGGTTSSTYIDLLMDSASASSGYPIQITLPNPTTVLVLLSGRFDMDSDLSNGGKGNAAIFIDNVLYRPTIGFESGANLNNNATKLSLSTYIITTLSAGNHTIQFKMNTTNSRGFNVYDFTLTAFSLGK